MKKLIILYSIVLVFSLAFSAYNSLVKKKVITSATPQAEAVATPVEEKIEDQKSIEDQIMVQLNQDQDINYDIQLKQLEAELN